MDTKHICIAVKFVSTEHAIGCADEGLWIFSLEDSKKRPHAVSCENQSDRKAEEHELIIVFGCFGQVRTAIHSQRTTPALQHYGLYITDSQFESFHAKVKQKWDRHLNEHEGKFPVDQVGTYSVSSVSEDNQRKKMKSNEELSELLQTETTHIMKTNEQSLIQTKPILKTSSRRGDPVDD